MRGAGGAAGAGKVATRALSGLLKLSEAVGQAQVPQVARAACGALANLLYWEASLEALDDAIARRVFGRTSS